MSTWSPQTLKTAAATDDPEVAPRVGRRKPFVLWSGVLMGVATALLSDPADLAERSPRRS
ncbi:hypothetical protein [Streptomyces sp. NPDC102462]|uniref:hypothetical protein n=1 Tax=Streptomyces sp. NPDC102462 TaxID=3366178 RepID=UPI0038289D35